jgi:hypothetical protein
VLATVSGGDLGLLLNTGSAIIGIIGRRSIVVDAVGTVGGLAVVSTEGGTIDPSHCRSRNARAERNLRVSVMIKPRVNSRKVSMLLTVKVSGTIFPSRRTVKVTKSLRGSD